MLVHESTLNPFRMNEGNESTKRKKYTQEQKIVAAVWVHERCYNNQKWEDINRNFLARFHVAPPMMVTLLSWERNLFSHGSVENKEKLGRPLARLMHVPYVKASLKEAPDLSLRERAKVLGLPQTTLLNILREDLNMEFELNNDKSNNRNLSYNNGKWKMKNCSETRTSSTNALEEDVSE